MYMILFVLDDPTYLSRILDAWANNGISGATIIESTGLNRQLSHIPMRYSYGETPLDERGNLSIFVIVQDENKVRDCLNEIEKIVGDLDEPNTGVFTAWPLTIQKGVPPIKPE